MTVLNLPRTARLEKFARGATPRFGVVGADSITESDPQMESLIASIRDWSVYIEKFKHGLEVPLCITPDDSKLRRKHRLVLSQLVQMGEAIRDKACCVNQAPLDAKGFSYVYIGSNLAYLKKTFALWHLPKQKDEKLSPEAQKVMDAFAAVV